MSDETSQASPTSSHSLWHVTKIICFGVVILSVLSCVGIAAYRSDGLAEVKVVALAPEAEPRDHAIPLFKRNDALPDYELIIHHSSGRTTNLGTKPNTSAAAGLTWTLNEPVPVCEIIGLRLQDQDKLVSDAITEVQVVSASAESDGYRFEFQTERSASVGVQSFFRTPIGMAISAAFFLAVLLMLASAFCV